MIGDDNATLAVRYLRAANAVPVAIAERDGNACLLSGRIVADASSSYWVDADQAGALTRQTRLLAGDQPSVARLTEALRQAAADRHVVLTAHQEAIRRAQIATAELDQAFERLREGRLLREFNRHYREHRRLAKENGCGFMTYATALARLKRALIPILASGRDANAATVNFRAIFKPGRLARPRTKPSPTTSWF
jgi:hypothetical protein